MGKEQKIASKDPRSVLRSPHHPGDIAMVREQEKDRQLPKSKESKDQPQHGHWPALRHSSHCGVPRPHCSPCNPRHHQPPHHEPTGMPHLSSLIILHHYCSIKITSY